MRPDEFVFLLLLYKGVSLYFLLRNVFVRSSFSCSPFRVPPTKCAGVDSGHLGRNPLLQTVLVMLLARLETSVLVAGVSLRYVLLDVAF